MYVRVSALQRSALAATARCLFFWGVDPTLSHYGKKKKITLVEVIPAAAPTRRKHGNHQ